MRKRCACDEDQPFGKCKGSILKVQASKHPEPHVRMCCERIKFTTSVKLAILTSLSRTNTTISPMMNLVCQNTHNRSPSARGALFVRVGVICTRLFSTATLGKFCVQQRRPLSSLYEVKPRLYKRRHVIDLCLVTAGGNWRCVAALTVQEVFSPSFRGSLSFSVRRNV